VGCTTHQSEILVRPQHGAAMIRNFPAINGIASICSLSTSYWYWKICLFLILFFSPFHFIFLYMFNSTFLTASLCLFHLSHTCIVFSLCYYSSGVFYFLFLSLLTSIFYISSFLYFFLSSFLFILSLILFTILILEDLFPFYLSSWVRCNCKVLLKIITFFISQYDLWQPVYPHLNAIWNHVSALAEKTRLRAADFIGFTREVCSNWCSLLENVEYKVTVTVSWEYFGRWIIILPRFYAAKKERPEDG